MILQDGGCDALRILVAISLREMIASSQVVDTIAMR